MKDIKDWSKAIEDLKIMDADAVLNLYSEMLATAHDLGYKVPDEQLIETEDADKLRAVIPPLHEGLVAFHATAKAEAEKKAKATKAAPKKKPVVANAADKKTASPKKPARTAKQKGEETESKPMTTPTAKKAATPKKVAAKKAPAKKVAKKAAKKAAAKNARTPAGGGNKNPFGEKAVIKVLNKAPEVREGTERHKRVMAVLKYGNKKVADFYAGEKPPLNRTDTLRFMEEQGWISIK
jgi:hypothetical protein